jgi:clan AA aspartic protease
MGLAYARVTLANPRRPELVPVEVDALADTGAVHLCIPEHIAIQLALDEFDRREVVIADGSRRTVPYVGPLSVGVANRKGLTGAMVLGDKVLLGAIPMEDMDLIVHPLTRQVIPNPQNPNIAGSLAVGVRPASQRN